MVIHPATEADLQAVVELVAQGRAALARQGVDQWQDGYPSPETIRRDLLRGDGRIVRIDGAAAAHAAREWLVRGIRSFRIDTHPDNGPMRALLVREGFACRGKVRYEAVRLAYEKPILG